MMVAYFLSVHGEKQKPKSRSVYNAMYHHQNTSDYVSNPFHMKAYIIHTLLLGGWSIQQNTSKP